MRGRPARKKVLRGAWSIGNLGRILRRFPCGYVIMGGKLDVIIAVAPFEGFIIFGSAIGAFVASNTGDTLKSTIANMSSLVKPEVHNKESYLDLLSMLYMIFKLARSKGWLSLESHIEEPHDSDLFNQFPQDVQCFQSLLPLRLRSHAGYHCQER